MSLFDVLRGFPIIHCTYSSIFYSKNIMTSLLLQILRTIDASDYKKKEKSLSK